MFDQLRQTIKMSSMYVSAMWILRQASHDSHEPQRVSRDRIHDLLHVHVQSIEDYRVALISCCPLVPST